MCVFFPELQQQYAYNEAVLRSVFSANLLSAVHTHYIIGHLYILLPDVLLL